MPQVATVTAAGDGMALGEKSAKGRELERDTRAIQALTANPDYDRAQRRLANAKYAHGASSAGLPMPTKAIKDKRAKAKVRQSQLQDAAHALRAQQLEVLMPGQTGFLEAEHEMEHTERMTQQQLAAHVDLQSQRKIFDIALPDFGPYSCAYTRSGRELLLGGRNGHIATFDWKAGKLGCELQVQESVHDVVWLHNETLFAVAQKKSLFIYDNQGIEIHCLRKHVEPRALAFLPYHFLLASIGNQGILRYQDVSTGKLIAECKTHYGACSTMRQNPQNAVLHLGHTNGRVTLWSPNNGDKPLVNLFAHTAPVHSVDVDLSGHYLATSGMEGAVKIWDLRMFKATHTYRFPQAVRQLALSQTGVLGTLQGGRAVFYKDALRVPDAPPYMTHTLQPGQAPAARLAFCPFEDVVGIGHAGGFSSILIPGAGEANFDTLEANPYQTVKQRQESEVHALLDRVPAETIGLETDTIGQIRQDAPDHDGGGAAAAAIGPKAGSQMGARHLKLQAATAAAPAGSASPAADGADGDAPPAKKLTKQQRKIQNRKLRRKMGEYSNVMDARKLAAKEAHERKVEAAREAQEAALRGDVAGYDPLSRFAVKR